MAAKKDDKKAAEEEEEESSGSKLPFITLIMVVLNLGATGFLTYMALFPVPPPPAPEALAAASASPLVGPLVGFQPFLVNLNEEKKSHYLRTKMQLEVIDVPTAEMVEQAKPILRSEILAYLSSLSVADTRGAEAKQKITEAMLEAINERIGKGKAKRLFFTEFVVQ